MLGPGPAHAPGRKAPTSPAKVPPRTAGGRRARRRRRRTTGSVGRAVRPWRAPRPPG